MNSLEQLCINYTNERLQQYFNEFVFTVEEALYRKENVAWTPIDFPDNGLTVELLQEKLTGVFAMLDEECFVPQGSDQVCLPCSTKSVSCRRGRIRWGVSGNYTSSQGGSE